MDTVKLFGYTAGAFAISHFFREWPLANRRFYLSHLHFNQGTSAASGEGSISKFLIERARFQYCIGSSLIASLKAFQKCALPLVLLFGIEAGLRHALSANGISSVMKEKMLELHLETVIAGALVGTLVGRKQKSLRSSGEFAALGAILGCSLAVARIIANE